MTVEANKLCSVGLAYNRPGEICKQMMNNTRIRIGASETASHPCPQLRQDSRQATRNGIVLTIVEMEQGPAALRVGIPSEERPGKLPLSRPSVLT